MKSARIAISLAFLLGATNLAAAATCPAPTIAAINYGAPGAFYGNGAGVGGGADGRNVVPYDYSAFCNQPGKDGKERTATFVASCIKAATNSAAAASASGGGQVAAPTRAASGLAAAGSAGAAGGAAAAAAAAPCVPETPVAGVCGSTVNGQKLASAPAGNALCSTGRPSPVDGAGPWNWACAGSNGGGSNYCSAAHAAPSCPPAQIVKGWIQAGAFVWFPTLDNKSVYQYSSTIGEQDDSPTYPIHIATAAARTLPGYENCTETPPINFQLTISPVKVSLAASTDAVLDSSNPTAFLLTLKDGRILDGFGTGGLGPNEGWLMVRRSADPLVFPDGKLNADNWFGDRDHRSANGYTDLAETFAAFLTADEYGHRYIPLRKLDGGERTTAATGKITDPSVDLRVVDGSNAEHFASDHFDRIYVDFTPTLKGDGPDGKTGKNLVLGQAMVRTIGGSFQGSVDQWFVLDIPADYSAVDRPSTTRVLPPRTTQK